MLFWLSLAIAREPWADLMAVGDCTGVLAALPAPTTDAERLAVGRCALSTGQVGRTLEVLGSTDGGKLAPWVSLIKGKALLEKDRFEEAATALATAPTSSETTLLRGRALVQAKKSLEARDMLRGLLGGPLDAEARWWLAIGAWDRGEKEAAIATWKAVWINNPTSPFAEKSAEKLRNAGVLVPDYSTPDGRALVMAHAKTLLSLRLPEKAIPMLDIIHGQDPFDTQEEILFMADALFDARQYKRAVEWFARAGSTSSASVMFSYALATARSGNYDGAAILYSDLQARFPGTPQAEEARFKIPYMRYDARDWKAAIDGFASYLAKYPKGKFANDARWFTAWASYKLSGPAAVSAFDAVISSSTDDERVTAARYWRARLMGDQPALKEIATKSSTGYAWFAARRLGLPEPKLRQDVGTAPAFPAGFLAKYPDLQTAQTLTEAGLTDWARPIVQKYEGAAKDFGSGADLAMAFLLLDVEDYQGAKSLASGRCSSPSALPVCYPRPHHAVVQSIATGAGLDPLLPYAIMNAESGLDPSVTSPAGARGLMQLMPMLASDLASDISGFHIDQLYWAGVNARLGTKELGLLQARFARVAVSPSLPLVIASYNGGADSVERWLGTYTTPPDIDLFAEEISYTETRRYVRRVLGYLVSYQRAYAQP